MKRILNFAGIILSRIIYIFVTFMDIRSIDMISRVMGSLFLGISSKYRMRLYRHLKLVFPAKPDTEIHGIIRKNVKFVIGSFLRIFYYSRNFSEFDFSKVQFENLDEFVRIYGRGRGVVVIGAHIGMFTFIGGTMFKQGYPFHTIMRQFPVEWIERVFEKLRQLQNHLTIMSLPREAAVRKVREVLERKEIVAWQSPVSSATFAESIWKRTPSTHWRGTSRSMSSTSTTWTWTREWP